MELDYNDDSPTYILDFDKFFEMFDMDILPLCKTEKQVKRLLRFAIVPYINNEWPEFVRRVRRIFYETRLFNL